MLQMQRVADLSLATQIMAGSTASLPLSSLQRQADGIPKATGLSLQTPSQVHTLRHQSCAWFLISITLMTSLVDSVSLPTTNALYTYIAFRPILFCFA